MKGSPCQIIVSNHRIHKENHQISKNKLTLSYRTTPNPRRIPIDLTPPLVYRIRTANLALTIPVPIWKLYSIKIDYIHLNKQGGELNKVTIVR